MNKIKKVVNCSSFVFIFLLNNFLCVSNKIKITEKTNVNNKKEILYLMTFNIGNKLDFKDQIKNTKQINKIQNLNYKDYRKNNFGIKTNISQTQIQNKSLKQNQTQILNKSLKQNLNQNLNQNQNQNQNINKNLDQNIIQNQNLNKNINKNLNQNHKNENDKSQNINFENVDIVSEEILNKKLERIAQVILQVNQGSGPDILLLQEVDNKKNLDLLNEKFLKKANYKSYYFDLNNGGHGLAILTRLTIFKNPEYKNIEYTIQNLEETGIIYLNFKLSDSSLLHVFNFQFPSQGMGVTYREQAMKFLNRLRFKLGEDALVIAGGDTNITTAEEKNIYSKYGFSNWYLSHYEGCKKCYGTIYYPASDSWSFYDVIFYSKTLHDSNSNWYINPDSIMLANNLDFQKNSKLVPNAFNNENLEGVSNHFPIVLQIEKNK